MVTHIFRQESVPWSLPDLPLAVIMITVALSVVIKLKKVSTLFNVKVVNHPLTTAGNYVTNLFLLLV